ncbi:TIGR02234 family membrane protein [Nocardia brevicatena]|uniref:TIGR02234 family membrane protein n=1 Tax=Nocardia brevicatena TaxID=37327 RepID=UPI00031864FA|nr:TIGR02234 family membrane protein [Nocardia brevicatena]
MTDPANPPEPTPEPGGGASGGPGADPGAGTPADETAASSGAASRGRGPVVPLVLLAVAAAALWGSSRLTWVTVTSADGLTEPRTDEIDGGVWFGALTPLALMLLAAVAAVLGTRGWPRRVVGVIIAMAAAITAVPPLALLNGSGATAERAAALAELPGRAAVQEVVTSTGPALLAMVGAVAAFLAGVLLARMPERTTRLSGKYDNPVFRRAAATDLVTKRHSGAPTAEPVSERVLWDALDAGTDPTESDTADRDPDATTSASGDRADTPAEKPDGSAARGGEADTGRGDDPTDGGDRHAR